MSCAVRPATTALATPATTGRASPCSTIQEAEPNTPNYESEGTLTAAPCVPSQTGSSPSPSPCCDPAPPSTPLSRFKKLLDQRWGVLPLDGGGVGWGAV